MLHCPYQRNRQSKEDGNDAANCMIVTTACGFTVSPDGVFCTACIAQAEWNNAPGVPQLAAEDQAQIPKPADAVALVTGSPFFARLYKSGLRARLVAGDCSRYQNPNPMDMAGAFAKFRAATNDRDAQDLLSEMLDKQIQKAKTAADDVHDEETVRDKIATLAEDNGFVTPAEAADIRSGQ